jgi:MerR family transcriptional regulator/heat shock protein HspR
LGTDVEFLESLEAEGLIELKRTAEGDRVVSSEDAERIRVVLLLVSDLEVNMPGAEVIVHMREAMLAMQRQFGEILEAIVEEMRRRRPS